jgi:hypothetical protein
VSEFLEVRCGMHRFLVPSVDIDSIEVLKGIPEPFDGRRAPRELLLLDGRVLAGDDARKTPEHGVALHAAECVPLETRIVVDQVGALVHCDPAAIEPLPEETSQEYLFCVRPRNELPVKRFVWRRRIRRAVMTIRPAMDDRKVST